MPSSFENLAAFRTESTLKNSDVGTAPWKIFSPGDSHTSVTRQARKQNGKFVSQGLQSYPPVLYTYVVRPVASRTNSRFLNKKKLMKLTVKVCVDLVVEFRPAAEVNELEPEGLGVDEDVLVLDVPVQDSPLVTSPHRLKRLLEEAPGRALVQADRVGDVVEEVLAVVDALHHQEEAVGHLEVVDQADDAGDVGHLAHQGHLQGHLRLLGGDGGGRCRGGRLGIRSPGGCLQRGVRRRHVHHPGLGDELDRHGEPVPDAVAGVHGAEAALAKNGAQRVKLGELPGAGDGICKRGRNGEN